MTGVDATGRRYNPLVTVVHGDDSSEQTARRVRRHRSVRLCGRVPRRMLAEASHAEVDAYDSVR